MIGRATLLRTAAAAAALLVSAGQASAQDILAWLWGGGSTVGGSGKEIVRFSPQHAPGQIIVSFSDRRLYLVTRPGEAISYPIAIPRDQSRWSGVMSVTSKRENPSWTPTAEMRRENPKLPNYVPGGHPLNPLGVRALYLGSSMYRIHGTDAPWTIGTAVSKGCVRMYNQDVLDLYPRVRTGVKVTVTWNRYQTSSSGFMSSNDDGEEKPKPTYRKRPAPATAGKRPATASAEPAAASDETPVVKQPVRRYTAAKQPDSNDPAGDSAAASDDTPVVKKPVRRYTSAARTATKTAAAPAASE